MPLLLFSIGTLYSPLFIFIIPVPDSIIPFAFISEEDVEKIANKTIEQQKAVYDENFMKLDEVGSKTSIDKDDVDNDDPLYNDIVEFVISTRKASASLLQRRFKLGYNRAARIIDLLEERGIIGPANGSKPREVLVDNDEEDEE